jgi:hypothetical protein
MYVGLVHAVQAAGQLPSSDPRTTVDLMLAAIEGVKLRATFEPHIAESAEQQTIVAGLMRILLSSVHSTSHFVLPSRSPQFA